MSIKDDILETKQEIQEVKEKSLMLDIVSDYKKANRRQFIVILVILTMWFASIGLFIYYINTTGYEVVTESTEVENESGNANACVGDKCNNGEINYGESKSN